MTSIAIRALFALSLIAAPALADQPASTSSEVPHVPDMGSEFKDAVPPETLDHRERAAIEKQEREACLKESWTFGLFCG